MPRIKSPLYANLIKDWRAATGRSRLQLANELRISKTTVSNWELCENEPGVEALTAMAALAEGPWKQRFLFHAQQKSPFSENVIQLIASMGEAAAESHRKTRRSKRAPFVEVPLVGGRAGAGPAYFHDGDDIEGMVSVPNDICPNPSSTKCIRVGGDSMEPTLRAGTIAAVDASDRRPANLYGRMVAARHENNGVVIKRLVSVDGKGILASDKPGYPTIELSTEWEIVGGVIWWIQRP